VLCHDECLDVMKKIPDNYISSMITDPPYGLGKEPNVLEMLRCWSEEKEYKQGGSGFMGKKWDSFVPGPVYWKECYRVLKPGAHALVFGGTRTQDLVTLALRLAGFEIRDVIMYLFGSGMPKCQVWDEKKAAKNDDIKRLVEKDFKGWGNGGIKPAYEPIILVRKRVSEKTVIKNMLKHGTGALNIDVSRVKCHDSQLKEKYNSVKNNDSPRPNNVYGKGNRRQNQEPHTQGRFPTNIILSHHPECIQIGIKTVKGSGQSKTFHNAYDGESNTKFIRGVSHPGNQHGNGDGTETVEDWECHEDCPIRILDEQSGKTRSGKSGSFQRVLSSKGYKGGAIGQRKSDNTDKVAITKPGHGDSGGASRFFYCAKASKKEREGSKHPTIKPLKLIEYLVRMITPRGGTVIDPFMGSGTTGAVCVNLGVGFIGIEKEPLDEDIPSFFDAIKRIETAIVKSKETWKLTVVNKVG